MMVKKKQKGWEVHHYIPTYYSRAFCASPRTPGENFLFKYRKKYDKISKVPFSPDAVFYLPDLNASIWKGRKVTYAEQGFANLDYNFSKLITKCREYPIKELFDHVSSKDLLAFIVHQFLRVPANDHYYDSIFKNARFTFEMREHLEGESVASIIRDETFKKVSRITIPLDCIEQLIQEYDPDFHVKIFEYSIDLLVLSDNPVVYVDPLPNALAFLGRSMLALSPRRLLVFDHQPINGNIEMIAMAYNCFSYEQALDTIVAPSPIVLQAMLEVRSKAKNLKDPNNKSLVFNTLMVDYEKYQ